MHLASWQRNHAKSNFILFSKSFMVFGSNIKVFDTLTLDFYMLGEALKPLFSPGDPISQHPLFKRLSFYHWTILAVWSKLIWSQVYSWTARMLPKFCNSIGHLCFIPVDSVFQKSAQRWMVTTFKSDKWSDREAVPSDLTAHYMCKACTVPHACPFTMYQRSPPARVRERFWAAAHSGSPLSVSALGQAIRLLQICTKIIVVGTFKS